MDDIQEIMTETIKSLNQRVIEEGIADQCESTCVLAAIDTVFKELYVANVGDSRLVIGYEGGSFRVITMLYVTS